MALIPKDDKHRTDGWRALRNETGKDAEEIQVVPGEKEDLGRS